MKNIFPNSEIWSLTSDRKCREQLRAVAETPSQLLFFDSFDKLVAAIEVAEQGPGLIVIDLEACSEPEVSGALKKHKRVLRQFPILVCGPKGSADLMASFLDLGATDFTMKPLDSTELAMRVQRLKLTQVRHARYTLGFLKSVGAEFTSTELKLLLCFLSSEEKSIARNEVKTLLWEDGTVHPKTLDVHIFNLRKKLANIGAQIVTGRGGVWTLQIQSGDSSGRLGD